MILRPYQSAAIERTVAGLSDGADTCLVAPTGSGKTVMGVAIVERLDRRTLWLAHRRELVLQARERFGCPVGVIMPGYPFARDASIHVGSIQTVVRRELDDYRLIVIDEAHHAVSGSYRRLLDERPDRCAVLGLTATPFRLDGRGLGDVFSRLEVAATTAALCADGTLVEPVVYAPPGGFDLRGMRIRHGDFEHGALASQAKKVGLTGSIVEHWQRLGHGRTVVFAVGVEHSKAIVEAFRAVGISAAHLDGNMPTAQRDGILRALARGDVQVVATCMVLTEGWDLPALETCVIARPTASLCLHLQMIGRIMRSSDGKARCTVLDHAGNHSRLGFVTDPIEYSLSTTTSATPRTAAAQMPKHCSSCFMLLPRGATACPPPPLGCGASLLRSRMPEETDGNLVRLTKPEDDDFDARRRWFALRCETAPMVSDARRAFKTRYGYFPLSLGSLLLHPDQITPAQRLDVFAELEGTRALHGFKPSWPSFAFAESAKATRLACPLPVPI